MSSPKPTLGYPTRTAAVLALVEQGFDNRMIAQRIGVSTSTVSALIAKSRPAPRREQPKQPRVPYRQLEMLVMDLYEEGLNRAEIAERLQIRRETADNIIDYMRIGQADLAFGHDAAARSSRLLVAALKRHHPERCGQ